MFCDGQINTNVAKTDDWRSNVPKPQRYDPISFLEHTHFPNNNKKRKKVWECILRKSTLKRFHKCTLHILQCFLSAARPEKEFHCVPSFYYEKLF